MQSWTGRPRRWRRWSGGRRFAAGCCLMMLLLAALGAGCAHGTVVVKDPCPLPSEVAVDELLASGTAGSLWFRRMTLWCDSLEP